MKKKLERVKSMSVFMLLTVLMLLSFSINAQTITGKVTEDNGEPIVGVNIVEKGTSNGTITDMDGNFSLVVESEQAILLFSSIGFQVQEIPIAGKTQIDITLLINEESLDEVVIIGYGAQQITKVSGAISTVRAEQIEKQKPIRVEEALQGQTSGVNVVQNGSPGSRPTVTVRGIPSFSGSEPIVIIDGVPQTLNDLNSINSSDLESVNILKDAASTAIYGVQGGNGVIVVTTKNGKKNKKPVISFNTYFGQQQVMKKIGLLNASEYGAMINEGSVASGGDIIFPDPSSLGAGSDWQELIFHKAAISSQNLSVTGGSEKVSYFLSAGYLSQDGVVGGKEKSNFKRLNVSANLTFDITKKIRFILNTSYANIKNQGVLENSFNSVIGSALNFDPTVEIDNTTNTVGKYGYSNLILSEIYNPLTILDYTHNKSNGNRLWGKAELQYDILKGLKFSSRLGYARYDQVGKTFQPYEFYGPLNVENTMNADGTPIVDIINGVAVTRSPNQVTETQNENFNYTFETFINYNFKIQGDHSFKTVLGFSMAESTSSGFVASRQDVPFDSWDFADISSATGNNSILVPASLDLTDPSNPSVIPAVINTNGQTGTNFQGLTRRNLSYFGRINYDYQDKYLVSFSARRDGSIAFGSDNKFANFYAGSLGWIVTEEDFFNVELINHLKIRGSYGTVGNENVQPQYVGIVTGGPSYGSTGNSNGYTFGSTFLPGSTVNSFANTILSWEKQNQMNVGFDIIFADNKITINADYFEKKVDGLLFTDASPNYAGTSLPVSANIGSTKSTGFDISLGYKDTYFNELKFNTSFSFTTSENLVTETNSDGTAQVPGGNYFNGQSANATMFEKGYSPGYFFGYKTDGLFQTMEEVAASPTQTGAVPGDIKYVDVNNDGIITDDDRTKIGDPFPKFTLGWNLGLEYKNIYLNVFTYASVGNDIYRAYERNAQYTNKTRAILDRWTGPGTTNDARNPRYTFIDDNNNIRPSDRYVEDGSFIKIKNLVIGYTIPPSLYKNKVFSKISVYAQVKNLYTFTEYKGFDPEITGNAGNPNNASILNTGVDRGEYPQSRTYSIGLDLKF